MSNTILPMLSFYYQIKILLLLLWVLRFTSSLAFRPMVRPTSFSPIQDSISYIILSMRSKMEIILEWTFAGSNLSRTLKVSHRW
jgi:hypothetical protein